MYKLNINSNAFEELCYIQQCNERQFWYNLFKKKKHKLLHLCQTFRTVLYERHFGKSIKQFLEVKGFEYLQHSS